MAFTVDIRQNPSLRRRLVFNAYAVRRVCAQSILIVLAAHLCALFVCHGLGYDTARGFVPALHMDAEHNFPTLVATLMLLMAAVLCFASSLDLAGDRLDQIQWHGLACIFLFLAVDEWISVHESLSAGVHAALHAEWVPMFAWVIPYSIAFIGLACLFLNWFFWLDPTTRVRFAVAAAVFLTGAIGFELISGAYYETLPPDREKFRTFTGDLMATAEELLEFIGLSIFLYALTLRLDRRRAFRRALSRGAP